MTKVGEKWSLWRRWQKVSINNKVMIYMTAILAVATTFYTLMYRSSVKFAEENAKQATAQTDKLIAATERLASSTKDALDETKRVNRESADRAERAVRAGEKQADASKSQANTSQVSARAAQESASAATKTFAIGERPFITAKEIRMLVLKPGEQPKGEVLFTNSGRTPAYNVGVNVTTVVRVGVLPESPPYGNAAMHRLPLAPGDSKVVPMKFGIGTFVDQATIDKLGKGEPANLFLYVYGFVEYEDGIGRRHTTKYCGFYLKGPNDTKEVVSLYVCPTHNSAD